MRLPKDLVRLIESTFERFKENPKNYPEQKYILNGVTFVQAIELKKRYFNGYSVKFAKPIEAPSENMLKDKYSIEVSKTEDN